VAREADRRGMPVLGICRGQQALNVARGGTLHQHLADVTDGRSTTGRPCRAPCPPMPSVSPRARCWPLSWAASSARSTPSTIRPSTGWAPGLRAVAWAPDGIVEGVESPGRPLLLGVQWHAEGLVADPGQLRLFERLVEGASRWSGLPARAQAHELRAAETGRAGTPRARAGRDRRRGGGGDAARSVDVGS
jgi:putative glutamine amidotransferase